MTSNNLEWLSILSKDSKSLKEIKLIKKVKVWLTDRLTNQPMDRRTDGWTDKAGCRVACTRLMNYINSAFSIFVNFFILWPCSLTGAPWGLFAWPTNRVVCCYVGKSQFHELKGHVYLSVGSLWSWKVCPLQWWLAMFHTLYCTIVSGLSEDCWGGVTSIWHHHCVHL